MLNVNEMIDDILRAEGGLVDHPADRGGLTKFGITQKTLSHYYGRMATRQEVKYLEEDVARDIYEKNYYFAPRINNLPELIQPFIFDCAVNHGARRAIKLVQRVCNQAGYTPEISDDGAMGPNTKKAAHWAEQEMGIVFLKALFEERRNLYLVIVKSRPSQSVFLDGWMNRVNIFEREVA